MDHILTSPLEAWPGEIHLPHPDEFNRTMWQTWKDGINKPLRKSYAMLHLYGYTGLELIQKHGEWQMDIPLEEVRAWETDPDAERVKLMAWLGRSMIHYMDGITDPKG